MAQTEIQLFKLNQWTLSQWFSRHQKEGEGCAGVGNWRCPCCSCCSPASPSSKKAVVYAGGTRTALFTLMSPRSSLDQPAGVCFLLLPLQMRSSLAPHGGLLPPPAQLPGDTVTSAPAAQHPPLLAAHHGPRTAAYRKRKAAEAVARAPADVTVHLQQVWPAQEDRHWPHSHCRCVLLWRTRGRKCRGLRDFLIILFVYFIRYF